MCIEKNVSFWIPIFKMLLNVQKLVMFHTINCMKRYLHQVMATTLTYWLELCLVGSGFMTFIVATCISHTAGTSVGDESGQPGSKSSEHYRSRNSSKQVVTELEVYELVPVHHLPDNVNLLSGFLNRSSICLWLIPT